MRAFALRRGRLLAARHFGVSDRILWRFVELGHPGQSLPRAVIKTVGEDPVTIAAAAWAVTGSRRIQRRAADSGPLAATQEDRLRFL